MKKVILFIASAALVSGIMSSCHKSNKSNTAMDLLPGSWKGTFVAVDSNNNNILDVSEQRTDPFNEVYTFNKDLSGTHTYTIGSTTTIDTFSWTITQNYTYLNITYKGTTSPLRIDYISHNDLTLRNSATSPVSWTKLISL